MESFSFIDPQIGHMVLIYKKLLYMLYTFRKINGRGTSII